MFNPAAILTAKRAMRSIEKAIYDPAIWPYYGWHNDHAGTDRTANYLPAIQQDKNEFWALLCAIMEAGLYGGRALQLGIGQSGLSHKMWRYVFEDVVSVDMDAGAIANAHKWCHEEDENLICKNTSAAVFRLLGEFDFLFIDAGHLEANVREDYITYAPLVRKGGIIAFHDALERKGYEDEITVHKFLANFDQPLKTVGDVIGTAWMVKG